MPFLVSGHRVNATAHYKGNAASFRFGINILCFLFVVLFCATPCIGAEFSERVIGTLDGDTIEVLHNQRAERIRLQGIDCPEKRQAYGNKAKHAASALVFGKEVTLQTHGKDKYKRTLADVLLPDGTNVNHDWSKRAGAGGIGGMRLGTRCSKAWSKTRETRIRSCGLILNRHRCGCRGNSKIPLR